MLYFDKSAKTYIFETKEEQLEKYREYGYISAKMKELKTLYYKRGEFTYQPCEVIGFLVPSNPKLKEVCIIVEVEGEYAMIHKDYLKEMQTMKKKFDQLTTVQSSLF